MKKIKKGDQVIVISGRDKGKRGEVLSAPSADRIIVNDVNLVKKHTKPNPMKNMPGGILKKEAAIHISNIALLNPVTDKADRVAIRGVGSDKHRVFKSDGSKVDV